MADKESNPSYGSGGDDGGTQRLGPGIYEFAGFNDMVAALDGADRAALHRHELFDEPGALIEFITASDAPAGFKDELQEHLNDHIRTHPINQAISAAAWLGLRATRDGSPLSFFLRVGVPIGATVGVVPAAKPFVAVVVEVPEDWPWLPPVPGGPGTASAKIVINQDTEDLIRNYEVYDRNATSIRPGPLGLQGVTEEMRF